MMVLDTQGVKNVLVDPEIVCEDHLMDGITERFFCRGNLGTSSIKQFFKHHNCNEYCKSVGLPEVPKDTWCRVRREKAQDAVKVLCNLGGKPFVAPV